MDRSVVIAQVQDFVTAAQLPAALFEPATLADKAGEMEIELREQVLCSKKDMERNFEYGKVSWRCRSYPRRMLLKDYIAYQTEYRSRPDYKQRVKVLARGQAVENYGWQFWEERGQAPNAKC